MTIKGNAKIYIITCLRCGHRWASRKSHPLRCAKCKTPNWHKPRKTKKVKAIANLQI